MATVKPSGTSEICRQINLKNDNVQAFDTQWDEASSAVTGRPTDNMLKALQDVNSKIGKLKYVLQVYIQETTFSDEKYDYSRLKFMAQGDLEQKIKDSHFKPRNRDEDRNATGAPIKGKAKRQRQCRKQILERRLHTLSFKRPMFN